MEATLRTKSAQAPEAFYYDSSVSKFKERIDNCSVCNNKNPYKHVLGIGSVAKPKIMLVLMNPTKRNMSLHENYKGLRFPCAGVTSFWKFMNEAGVVSTSTYELAKNQRASDVVAKAIASDMTTKSIYLTELVKCTSEFAVNPSKEMIDLGKNLLYDEIRLIKPDFIVTFGSLVFNALTNLKIKLSDNFTYLENGQLPTFTSPEFDGKIVPTYFPGGRNFMAPYLKSIILIFDKIL